MKRKEEISYLFLLLLGFLFLIIISSGCAEKQKEKNFKACWVCKGAHWGPDCEYICPTRPEEDKDNEYVW